ncbi:MAG: type II secretion system protein, partial [Candidatus Sericytochromatia bacterium]|nr:type II secretion system protein [Candidatus Tanganyikabacteria bacterium]
MYVIMRKQRRQHGISMFETLYVTAMLGLLFSVVGGKFEAARDKANNAKVQNYTHGIQIAVEQYCVDSGGNYPESAKEFASKVVGDPHYAPAAVWPYAPWNTRQTAGSAWSAASASVPMGTTIGAGSAENPTSPTHYGAISYSQPLTG